MSDTVERLLAALEDRVGLVRKAAARDLGAAGDPRAVDPLVALLGDPDAEVREEAARALGRLRDPRAVPALEALATGERPALRRAAEDAIAAISRPRPAPAAAPRRARQPAERDALMAEALHGTGAVWEATPFGYEVELPLRGRKQRVRVIYENPDPDGDRMILVQTSCGPAQEQNFRWALRLNLKLAYGHLAIRRVENEEQFVFCQTLLEHTTQAEELRKAILAAGDRGDWIEKQITGGKDEN